MIVLSEKIHTARKKHKCMAYEWLEATLDSDFIGVLSFAEKRAIVSAKQNKGIIQIGQKYRAYSLIEGTDFFYHKCIPEIDDICYKYNMYPDM